MNDITLTPQNALIERDADGVFYLSREREVGAANWADDAPTPLATFDIRTAREIAAQLANAIAAHDKANDYAAAMTRLSKWNEARR
jgi:hypothetical protein